MTPEETLEKVQKLESIVESLKAADPNNLPIDSIVQMKMVLRSFFTKMLAEHSGADVQFLPRVLYLLIMLNTKHNFDKLLNSHLKYGLLLPYLQALTMQEQNPQLTIDSLMMVEKAFEGYLNIKDPLFFATEVKGFTQKQMISKEGFRKLRYSVIYVEILLKLTAMLSKSHRNAEALKKATKGFETIRLVAKSLKTVLETIASCGVENLKIGSGFENTLDWCFGYMDFLSEFELDRVSAAGWKEDALSWKQNRENTLKYLLQRIESSCKTPRPEHRKIKREWVKNFTISSVVRLEPFDAFEKRLDLFDIDDNLVMKVALLSSCCVFSIAAENRFISMEANEPEKKTPPASQVVRLGPEKPPRGLGAMEQVGRDWMLQKDQRFCSSEGIHLGALEIAVFGFDDESTLVEHLLGSYRKNYHLSFFVIDEVEESRLDTSRVSEYFEEQQDELRDSNLLPQLLGPQGTSRGQEANLSLNEESFQKENASRREENFRREDIFRREFASIRQKTEALSGLVSSASKSRIPALAESRELTRSADKALYLRVIKNIKSLKDRSANGKQSSMDKGSPAIGLKKRPDIQRYGQKRDDSRGSKQADKSDPAPKGPAKSSFSSTFANQILKLSSNMNIGTQPADHILNFKKNKI